MNNLCKFSKARTRKMGWMVHSEWCWWMTLVDHSSNTRPKVGPMGLMFEFMETRFGNSLNAQGPNGPN